MDYTPSDDIEKSLDLTEQLMLGYYREYGLVWDRGKRRELLDSVEHFHILNKGFFIGFFAFFKEEDHIYVCDLQLSPEHQNKGVGSAVMQHIIGIASSLGLMAIKLSVFKSNSVAMHLYRRIGFVVSEEGKMVDRLSYELT
ncbi:GNAT family N-acetyltransferase [Thiothrix subterranea]|uniref:GNAT family N-acetyltransferase n=1 Tax=Thiothrix subterranea TaxID=2735563 RepID=UPI00280B36CE|nr:GNAT family N-acetyltransferase [Thiothrix subterranea]